MNEHSTSHDCRCTVDSHDGVVAIDIQETIDRGHVVAAGSLVGELAEKSDGAVPVVVRVAAGTTFPTHDARLSFVEFLRQRGRQVRVIHVALEGRGFWRATMSALAKTVNRAVPNGPRIELHESLDAATAAALTDAAGLRGSCVDAAEFASHFRQAG